MSPSVRRNACTEERGMYCYGMQKCWTFTGSLSSTFEINKILRIPRKRVSQMPVLPSTSWYFYTCVSCFKVILFETLFNALCEFHKWASSEIAKRNGNHISTSFVCDQILKLPTERWLNYIKIPSYWNYWNHS